MGLSKCLSICIVVLLIHFDGARADETPIGRLKAKDASSKRGLQDYSCMKFEGARNAVDVEMLLEEMEESPYANSLSSLLEFWTTPVCSAPFKTNTKVPILFNTASNARKNENFPKTVHDYFVEEKNNPQAWLKVINSKSLDGLTFLDYLHYVLEERKYYDSVKASKDAALRIVDYVCKNDGEYSYYPFGCTQEESSRRISGLIKQAKLGELVSQRKLSYAYQFGIPDVLTPDLAEAVRWLTLAADGGDKQAQRELARKLSVNHLGFPQDTAKAIKWYYRTGDKDAFNSIGLLYSEGRPDLQKNSAEAINAWQKSFDLGNELAALHIGNEFKRLGDFKQAMRWYQTCWQVAHRNESASANIILLYVRGGGGIDRDYAEAAAWFKKSVYSDNFEWIYSLVKKMYIVDSDDSKYLSMPPVDFAAAFNAWEKLGRRGNSEAKYLADSILRVNESDNRRFEREKNREKMLFGR